jgi:peptidoglycan/LPS O-acetylase OafA/YrhL
MFFHVFPMVGDPAGVDLFFVLSGFLITTLLVDEHDRTGTFSLRRFYERRVRRLGPALAITLIGYLALNAIVLRWGYGAQPFGQSLESVGLGSVFLANEAVAYNHFADGLTHLWSLSMEEQFYALWPLALVAFLPRVTHRRFPLWLMLIAAGMIALGITTSFTGAPALPTWLVPLLHSAPILLGCATAFLVRRISSVSGWARYGTVWALPAIIAFVFMGKPLTDSQASALAYPLFWLVCAFLIACLALTPDLAAHRVLSTRWLVQIGVVSYGLYLYSAMVNRTAAYWLQPWQSALIAFPLAFSSYYLVERAFRRPRATSATRSVERIEPEPQPA